MLIEGEEVEIPVYVSPGHKPNMGTLEPDKLQWMSDIPATKPATLTEVWYLCLAKQGGGVRH